MATDPRAANCRGHHVNANGRVDGINLVWQPVPSARYACISAQLIDEDAAMGNAVVTVEVLNADGIKTAERVFMAWPYGGPAAEDSPAGPGNPNNQFTATSTYPSTKAGVETVGPLGFFVGNAVKEAISDYIWGYGLPDNRHICGYVVFKERTAVVVPPVVVPPTGATLEATIKITAEANDVLRINPDAALCQYGAINGLWPTSNEFAVTFGGQGYTAQRFRDPYSNAVTVFYCVTGQWDKIKGLTW
jgi:hypothetical protein